MLRIRKYTACVLGIILFKFVSFFFYISTFVITANQYKMDGVPVVLHHSFRIHDVT